MKVHARNVAAAAEDIADARTHLINAMSALDASGTRWPHVQVGECADRLRDIQSWLAEHVTEAGE